MVPVVNGLTDREHPLQAGADVLDGPRSLVPRQTEDRLHAAKAILGALLSYPEA